MRRGGSARLPLGCDKRPPLSSCAEALSAEGGFENPESGQGPDELASQWRLCARRAGSFGLCWRGAPALRRGRGLATAAFSARARYLGTRRCLSHGFMIRKIALAALAATAVFHVAVFIQYGTLWVGELVGYRELLLVFAFLLPTFWAHAHIARLFGADRQARLPGSAKALLEGLTVVLVSLVF